jgi:hypothetical protein
VPPLKLWRQAEGYAMIFRLYKPSINSIYLYDT